ncbi:polysaccharide biosynthesis/export family protein [Rhizobium sp. CC-YZS058]|uniref:polysaccharide biosynthesis/export family protein n=1 Tax=Rhizobium sp. CC-YZS058 TaxID=3042153 RepID=UPI002B060BCD|nr:polysaccharide biosynthesis/export family protein [Rhizobium sp. CC-YZS058]MEA3537426.1 polysaccharide biosynthesis/export family protein [Rhizobium sp. CC-YZS058]
MSSPTSASFATTLRRLTVSGLALAVSFLGVTGAQAETYRLGVQDKLKIHVSEWPALTGEFTVGADGQVSLPIVGEIKAMGLLTGELAATISRRLQEKGALKDPPDTAVDIASYRPFYILGQVATPGEYSYRPGMVVLNALSLAGGLYRSVRGGEWALDASAINSVGQLSLLKSRKLDLEAERQRLTLEAAGDTVFPSPPPNAPVEFVRAMSGQKLLFDVRLQRFQDQKRALEASKEIHTREVNSLADQIAVGKDNIEAAKVELENVRSLTKRGLASNRLYPMERTLSEVRNELGDLEIRRLRAEKDLNEVTGQLVELEGTRKSDAMGGLQSIKSQLLEIEKQEGSLKSLLQSASNYSADLAQDESEEATPVLTYTIVRLQGDATVQIEASEVTRVLPGDIVKVERVLPKTQSASITTPPAGSN